MFLKSKGDELLKKNLYRNFVLHVCNLFDFGLISSQTVYKIIRQVQDLVKKDPEHARLLKKTWTIQRKNWLDVTNLESKIGKKFFFSQKRINNPNCYYALNIYI